MPKFHVGQIIHHRRYDYRGVIAKVDSTCQAVDDWYYRNRTQPDRSRPWYFVLVDGGQETYVAEENLEPDRHPGMVHHPLVTRLFAAYSNGRYHRHAPN